MSRRRRRPTCGSVFLALAALAAGAVVVAHEVVVLVAGHPFVVAVGVGLAALTPMAARSATHIAPTVALRNMGELSPGEFEEAVADLCRRDGCTRVRVVGGSGDLGADVIATLPDGRRMVVQCKRYAPGRRVGSPEVQRVGGTYAIVHGGDVALVVTTAMFTEAAQEYAARAGIQLVDSAGLTAWVRGRRPPWA